MPILSDIFYILPLISLKVYYFRKNLSILYFFITIIRVFFKKIIANPVFTECLRKSVLLALYLKSRVLANFKIVDLKIAENCPLCINMHGSVFILDFVQRV